MTSASAPRSRLLGVVLRAPLVRHLPRLAAFGAVGGIAFLVDLGAYNGLRATLLPDKPILAKVASVAIAMVAAWLGNRHLTFRDADRDSTGREFVLFSVANGIGLAIAAGCLFVSHYLLGLTSTLADNVSGNGVGLVLGTAFRYVAYRRFVFRT